MLTQSHLILRPATAALAATLAGLALFGAATPAKAWWPGYYAPWSYYYTPPAYYYPPPPAYYTPPPAAAYGSPPAPTYAPTSTAPIAYTNRPAFKNAAGQICREFTTNEISGQPSYGTACRDRDGQWRVSK